jgi:hypothetical protein
MADPAYLLFVLAMAIQIPVGALLYLDARRLGLEDPEIYWLGVVVPAAGFVVVLYYLSERKDLPRRDPGDSADGDGR